jgi:hypothetical protein
MRERATMARRQDMTCWDCEILRLAHTFVRCRNLSEVNLKHRLYLHWHQDLLNAMHSDPELGRLRAATINPLTWIFGDPMVWSSACRCEVHAKDIFASGPSQCWPRVYPDQETFDRIGVPTLSICRRFAIKAMLAE